jgi:hypothetical protein
MIVLVDPTSVPGGGEGRQNFRAASSELSSFGKRVFAFFGQAFFRSVWLVGTAILKTRNLFSLPKP